MKKQKKIFFISPVRNMELEILLACEMYTAKLEQKGYKVFWPIRDNPHKKTDSVGDKICDVNMEEIFKADEIHVWHSPESRGGHFDLGGVYMLIRILGAKKRVIFANKDSFSEGNNKSFIRVLKFLEDITN